MHAHLPRVLLDISLCALPLLIWIPLRLWADEEPRNQEEPGDRDQEPDLLLAA